MNILYTLNDKFVPQVGAAICSVCENNKNVKEITFYIFSYGISKINKKYLSKLCYKYNRNISVIELDDLEKYFNFEFDTHGWNKVIVARLLMGSILPKEVDRILYMDGDTIVRGNLEILYNQNLNNKILGMSIEPTVDKKRKELLGLKSYPYYNSGVLLVDLKKWRNNDIQNKIIKYYREQKGNLFAADQDALNVVLKNDIFTISPKYNFYNIFTQYSYNFLKKLMKPIDYSKYISKDVFTDARTNPVIIHYLGEERPWRKGNTHKYKNDYKKYSSLTKWKDNPDEEGWKLYFICWRIFNYVTKPFPSIRYKIINSLIPAFMKHRKKKLQKEKNEK